MKKLLVVTLVLFLLAITVMPVFAAGPSRAPRGPFTLVGTISTIDPATGAVTVNVLKGNKLAQPFIGQSVTLKTAAATIYLRKTTATATRITFADLKVGDPVSVSGNLLNGVWTAARTFN